MQDDELAFWTGRHAGRGAIGHTVEPPDIVELVRLNFERRVRFVAGDESWPPASACTASAATRPGCRSCASRPAGGPLVLASDAAHFYANLEEDRPFAIVHSLPGMYAAFDRVRALRAATTSGSCRDTTRSCPHRHRAGARLLAAGEPGAAPPARSGGAALIRD